MTSKRELITKDIQNSLLYLRDKLDTDGKRYFVFVNHQIPNCIYLDENKKYCCNWICDSSTIPCNKLIDVKGKERHLHSIISQCIDYILLKHNNEQLQ